MRMNTRTGSVRAVIFMLPLCILLPVTACQTPPIYKVSSEHGWKVKLEQNEEIVVRSSVSKLIKLKGIKVPQDFSDIVRESVMQNPKLAFDISRESMNALRKIWPEEANQSANELAASVAGSDDDLLFNVATGIVIADPELYVNVVDQIASRTGYQKEYISIEISKKVIGYIKKYQHPNWLTPYLKAEDSLTQFLIHVGSGIYRDSISSDGESGAQASTQTSSADTTYASFPVINISARSFLVPGAHS